MQQGEWKFAVVGVNQANFPRYIGFTDAIEDALKLRTNSELIGWKNVAIFDPYLQQVDEKGEPIQAKE